ncbi:unnamed protein product [Polarella glacialis]|uniref:CCHC-type domain-containing protein n=1 Tax=Polarella glacialis TaxID=89957 RepID=A0A813HMZ5_POLGL|nr:unnamed protein product [Polarella glacialis]|mmetsp:Transcript_24936/g.44347  ORF Transcript_24936/g.44347 Transcript_24936/m.44347 type:complete len:417 (+) Transcript_24936:83-1333(+)
MEESGDDIPLADLDDEELQDEVGEATESKEDDLFFEDFAGFGTVGLVAGVEAREPLEGLGVETLTQQANEEEEVQASAADESAEEAAAQGICTQCGLPGHNSASCPFGHPETIDLGEMEESDSDDDLAELHPLFSRYVASHVGALTPKTKRGLTGGGRYFGDDKEEGSCWACGQTGHDAGECPDKGCFFCSKKGHESRECPQRAKQCSHCSLRGHAAVACPTLASQQLSSFDSVRCMRCGDVGHPNCGLPALMTSQHSVQSVSSSFRLVSGSSSVLGGGMRPHMMQSSPVQPHGVAGVRPWHPAGNHPNFSGAVAAVGLRQKLLGGFSGRGSFAEQPVTLSQSGLMCKASPPASPVSSGVTFWPVQRTASTSVAAPRPTIQKSTHRAPKAVAKTRQMVPLAEASPNGASPSLMVCD